MNTFKFLQNNSRFLSNNILYGRNADEWLLRYLCYRKVRNEQIAFNDLNLRQIDIPFDVYIRVNTWRTIVCVSPEIIEIEYKIIDERHSDIRTGTCFTMRMHTNKLMRILNEF